MMVSMHGRIQDFKLEGVYLKFVLGYFVWKITILREKIIFFPILGGDAGCAPSPSPLDPPLQWDSIYTIKL